MPPRRAVLPALRAIAVACAFLASGCGDPKIEYKGLNLSRARVVRPSEADVGRFLEQIRVQVATARPLEPDAALQRGHRAVIDFAGSIGGAPFPGGSGTGVPLVLGSGQMIPGFEDGIAGMKAGESKTINVTFPRDYQEASLAGKAAQFRITVRRAERLLRPPLDDALAEKVSGGRIKDLAALRKAAREQLYQNQLQQSERVLRAQAADRILAQWTKEPGGRQVNKELDRVVQQHLQAASQRGAGPAQGGPDAEQVRTLNRPGVVRSLKLQRALEVIARREGIVIGDPEVEQAAGRMAQAQGQDPQAVVKYLRENNLFDVIRRQVLEERVLSAVLQQAVIAEPPPAR